MDRQTPPPPRTQIHLCLNAPVNAMLYLGNPARLAAHGQGTFPRLLPPVLCPPSPGWLAQASVFMAHRGRESSRPGLTFLDRMPRDKLLSVDTGNLITSIFSLFYSCFGVPFEYFLSSSLV